MTTMCIDDKRFRCIPNKFPNCKTCLQALMAQQTKLEQVEIIIDGIDVGDLVRRRLHLKMDQAKVELALKKIRIKVLEGLVDLERMK